MIVEFKQIVQLIDIGICCMNSEVLEDFRQREQINGLLYFLYKQNPFIIQWCRKIAELCGDRRFDGDIASQFSEFGLGRLRNKRMQIDAVKQ